MPIFVVVHQRAFSFDHRDVAVIEVDTAKAMALRLRGEPWRPRRIRLGASEPTATRIVKRWNDCYRGSTSRCRFNIAMSEAHILAEKLNAEARIETLDCTNHRD